MRCRAAVSAFCLFLLAIPLCAQKSGVDEARAKKERLEKEIEILDKQLRQNEKKSASALSSLTLLRKKVSNRKKLLNQSDRIISQYDRKIAASSREVAQLQSELDTMTVYFERLVRNAYKNRDSRTWFVYLLSSGSLSQAVHRYSYLKSLSSSMNRQAAKIMESRDRLEKRKTRLVALRHEAAGLRNKRASDLGKLRKEEASSSKVVAKLKQDKTKYQSQLASKKKQMEALNREVARLISGKSGKNVDVKLSSKFSSNKGLLPWPAEGPVVESFGEHYHPVYKKVKMPFNNGINIAVPPGTGVKCVFDGEVKQVIVMPGYNKCILVQHGSYFTFYCKLSEVIVKAGEKVRTGQKLGKVDTISGETQLHFQLWEGTKPRNPESWLR